MSGKKQQRQSKQPAQMKQTKQSPLPGQKQAGAATTRRAQRVLSERRAKRNRMLMKIGGGAALAVLAVVALIVVNNLRDSGVTSAVVIPMPTAVDVQVDGRSKGDPNAPVQIVEWGDYQCPACGLFARDLESSLIEEYVATGKVHLTYKSMAFLGNESRDAAKAAVCADEQGAFWDMHYTLFHNQAEKKDAGAFSRDRLNEMAEAYALDMDAFGSCMKADATDEAVDAMILEAESAGINSTPTFIVNGAKVTGANYANLRQAIEAALAGR